MHIKFKFYVYFTLIFLTFLSTTFFQQVEAAETMTVQEAIENGGENVTVEAYITGTQNETEEPFETETNLRIADSLEEQDEDKLMYVELPYETTPRENYNLVDNQEKFEQKVKVTGDVETYFSQPGIKSTSEIIDVESDDSSGEGNLSVADAIADNSGNKTVEGYIVGHAASATSYRFDGFNSDTNIAIADAADETNSDQILNIQLPAGKLRDEYGLQTNPEMEGTKIEVSGSLEEYYSSEGLKAPTGINTLEKPEPSPPDEPASLTMAEARAEGGGATVILEGIVTADSETLNSGNQLSTYMQDETGGIKIFAFSADGFPNLSKGDEVRVTGKLEEYNGLLEVVPETDGIEVLSSNNEISEPEGITLEEISDENFAEPLEGTLVNLEGYVSAKPDSLAGGGYNLNVVDENFNGTTLRVMEATDAIDSVEEGTWYEFTAILSQYNSYQLLIRDSKDIEKSSEQPEAPTAEGEYTSVVESVTDGDTISLQEPVLGATNVRYLNIDTPEKFGTDNQIYHGEMATEYLQTLLEPGDEVTLKLGEEATDDYGRLLAQVINEDGVNTNLEMVKEGYASTYFISPIGDETVYEEFQAAAKEAKDAERGIWDPEDSLDELPFVFRANNDGDPLDKPVGHFDTKEYVEPVNYQDVPVDKRVFFWSEEDAASAGYTPIDGYDPGNGDDSEEEAMTIDEARHALSGDTVIVEGVATTISGNWGSNGFYVQDESAGIYVYQGDTEIERGDKVRVEGERDAFNGEIQIGNASVEVIGQDAALPNINLVNPAEITEENQGQLITMEDVTISDITEENYGTVEFTVTAGEESVLVRLDNRTGFDYDAFIEMFDEGDVVEVTGVSSRFNETMQVKPRGESDFKLSDNEEEDTPSITLAGGSILQMGNQEHVEVTLTANDLVDINGFEIDFDSEDLSLANVESLYEGIEITHEEDDGLVAVGLGKDVSLTGDFELFELTFDLEDTTSSEVDIEIDSTIATNEGRETDLDSFSYKIPTVNTDLNGDGEIGVGDLSIIGNFYGSTSESDDWKEANIADLNGDDVIDLEDLMIETRLLTGNE